MIRIINVIANLKAVKHMDMDHFILKMTSVDFRFVIIGWDADLFMYSIEKYVYTVYYCMYYMIHIICISTHVCMHVC